MGPILDLMSLPVELTSFVGREKELSVARDLLEKSRLVTLTGAGGSGKTRLALELASSINDQFQDGVIFVALAPLSEPQLVAPAVIQALGLAETGRSSAAETLVLVLRDAQMLLVLDNCEHLTEECAALVERLLKGCSKIRVLATSRQPLEISGETTFSIPPLSLPSIQSLGSVRELAASEAARLFAITDSNAQTIARVCHRLDGLPLAIELGAARVRSMAPDEILARLDDQFSLLARAGRADDPRHQTLRATIEWSHDLLSQPERVLFRRLSVFVGGWHLDDAETVCSDALLPMDQIMDLHARLVDRSLVFVEPGASGATRYRFLETIRQDALRRLNEANESDLLMKRHFLHFLAIAESYYDKRISERSDAGLAALAGQRDNFRAALGWGINTNQEGSLRLAAALDDFWHMISPAEGWQWLQRALPFCSEENPIRLRAMLTAGKLSAYVPAYPEGVQLLRELASIAEQVGDRTTKAWANLWLGRLMFVNDDVRGSEEHLERALAAHTDLDIPLGRVRSLALLGLVQALLLEDLAEGERKLEASVALAHDIGDSWGEGYAHMMLGLTAGDAEDFERAATHARAALSVSSLGPILGVPLQGMAKVAVEKDPARAMRLLGGADGHLQRTSTVEPAFARARAETTRQRAEELLGAQAAARLFEEGRAMTTEQAIDYALTEPAPSDRRRRLSSREAQVAVLVARGQTNRQIARTLHISVRTAESHVDHIRTKLGVTNRVQVAAWATENLGSELTHTATR
jgi:predicted ATPase/DNA-binding CsgD family transcriptional regulator